jgi:hypothetical protein
MALLRSVQICQQTKVANESDTAFSEYQEEKQSAMVALV